jgi:hypothetical protein
MKLTAQQQASRRLERQAALNRLLDQPAARAAINNALGTRESELKAAIEKYDRGELGQVAGVREGWRNQLDFVRQALSITGFADDEVGKHGL